MLISNVRCVNVLLPNGEKVFTVVDSRGLPIDVVERFLTGYLRGSNSSTNTIESYARHLALFFRWLDIRGVDWEHLDFDGFCTFAQDLQDGTLPSLRRVGQYRPLAPRSRNTASAVVAAIYSFLGYWRLEGRGPKDLRLFRDGGVGGRSKHSFLAHVSNRNPLPQARLRIRGPRSPIPKVIDFEAGFGRLISEASSHRDRLLVSAMFDGGLRISQALGLHHEDIDIARNRVRVVRRTNNANGALSKQRDEFFVSLPPRFFTHYAASLTEEQLALGIDSDYVFVNLRESDRGRPMSYSNAFQIIGSLGRRANVELSPHTLRHTHGTSLAKAGWSAPEIAKRLGHSSNASADVYIHLADDDIAEKYALSPMARMGA